MAAAVIISVAVGIWVGAVYVRNQVAWGSARTAKGRWNAAKKKRLSGSLAVLWPIGGFIVLGALAVASRDEIALTPDGGVSSPFFALAISAVLLGAWFVFRYADGARSWKGAAEARTALGEARKKRWATLWPAVIAVVILLGVLVALMSTQSG